MNALESRWFIIIGGIAENKSRKINVKMLTLQLPKIKMMHLN